MAGCTFEEAQCLQRIMGPKHTFDLKQNTYIRSIAKADPKMIGTFYRSRNYLSPHDILQLSMGASSVEKDVVVIFGRELFGDYVPVSIEFKRVYQSLLEKNYSSPSNFFFTTVYGESLTGLLLFTWKVLDPNIFLGSPRYVFHGLNPVCHLHLSNPPIFSLYSIHEKFH